MYKNYQYVNAGENYFGRYGHEAQERLERHLTADSRGWYCLPCDAGKWWTIGTSTGKYGEFARYRDTYFSVKDGCIFVKQGSSKEAKYLEFVKGLLQAMKDERNKPVEDEDEEVED